MVSKGEVSADLQKNILMFRTLLILHCSKRPVFVCCIIV